MPRLKLSDCEPLTLALEARVTFDPAREHNLLYMKFLDTTVEVSDAAGNRVGSVCCPIGGGLLIEDRRTGKNYRITAEAVWDAFERALAAAAPTEEQPCPTNPGARSTGPSASPSGPGTAGSPT